MSATRNATDGNLEGVRGLLLAWALSSITAIAAATLLRLLLIVTVIVSIVAIVLRSRRAQQVAAVCGIIIGLVGAIICVFALLLVSSVENVPLGIGTIILMISSAGVTVTAFVLLRSTKSPVALPPVPPLNGHLQ